MRHVLLQQLVGSLKLLGFTDVSTRPPPVLPDYQVPLVPGTRIGGSGKTPETSPVRTVRLKTETFMCPVVTKFHPGWAELSVDLAAAALPCFEIDKPLVVWDSLETVKDDNIRATVYIGGELRVVEGKGKTYNVSIAGVRVPR